MQVNLSPLNFESSRRRGLRDLALDEGTTRFTPWKKQERQFLCKKMEVDGFKQMILLCNFWAMFNFEILIFKGVPVAVFEMWLYFQKIWVFTIL